MAQMKKEYKRSRFYYDDGDYENGKRKMKPQSKGSRKKIRSNLQNLISGNNVDFDEFENEFSCPEYKY